MACPLAASAGGDMAPELEKSISGCLLVPWTAHKPKANGQGTGPQTGRELNIHKNRNRNKGLQVHKRNNERNKSGLHTKQTRFFFNESELEITGDGMRGLRSS